MRELKWYDIEGNYMDSFFQLLSRLMHKYNRRNPSIAQWEYDNELLFILIGNLDAPLP